MKATISLSTLMQRAAETPRYMTSNNKLNPAAVISDLLFDAGGDFLKAEEEKKVKAQFAGNANYRDLILIICYLLHDSWFLEKKNLAPAMAVLLFDEKFKQLAGIVKARQFITDGERREELVRLVLSCLSLVPEGESEIKAKDRLTTLDSVERVRLIEKTRKAQERAKQLREEMARREAEEAASKMSRE